MDSVTIKLGAAEVVVPIGMRLCQALEEVSGASSFIDPLDALHRSLTDGKPSMSSAAVVLRAACQAAGADYDARVAAAPLMEAWQAAAAVAAALVKALKPQDDTARPPEAAPASG